MLLSLTSMLEAGATLEELANAPGLTALEVEQHFQERVPATATNGRDSMEQSDLRLQELSEKISLAANVAGIAGDTRSHLSALSLQLRCELEQRAALAARDAKEKEAPRDAGDVQFTCAQLDGLAKHYAANSERIDASPASRAWCLLREERVFETIVQKIWRDRSILPMLLAVCEAPADQVPADQGNGKDPNGSN